MKKMCERHKKVVFASLTLVIVSIFSIFISNKTLPTAEGWYSYYAKCINSGEIVYKDFEYLFTPIYMYLISLYTRIFGYSIIVLRIGGGVIFVSIALILYITLTKVFSEESSMIAAITGVFYLQSDAYTVFYDYIRVMDIFTYLSILFMILTIFEWKNTLKSKKIYLWAFFSSMFFLIKQNMGGLFLVYSCIFILFYALIHRLKIVDWFFLELKYIITSLIPVFVTVFVFWRLDLLSDMVNSVFFSAVDAKGGILVIFFNWIINGFQSYSRAFLMGIIFVLLLYINQKIAKWSGQGNIFKVFIAVFFAIYVIIELLVILNNSDAGLLYSLKYRIDVTFIFIIDFVMVLYYVILLIYEMLREREINHKNVIYLALFGSYFTQCYGAGMSGGLSIGESALGIGLVIAILIDICSYKYGAIFQTVVTVYCANLICSCIGAKMVYPCEWWNIDEPSVYEATKTTDIDNLAGIKLSESTANLYQSIVDIISETTEKNDTIYAFPECPIFYVLSDRNDPGVYAKVQWFDVASYKNIINDIDVIENKLPKVIIIHNLYDITYEGHENLFNYGQKSGTRIMRDALYRIVNTYDYTYKGTFIFGKDNFAVYCYEPQKEISSCFRYGNGTKDSPYQISNLEELINLANMTNQGNHFENTYFIQTEDIDCASVVWVPIGFFSPFKGNFYNNGYKIYNINTSNFNTLNSYGESVIAQQK